MHQIIDGPDVTAGVGGEIVGARMESENERGQQSADQKGQTGRSGVAHGGSLGGRNA
jgi:hypothetical protein